MHDLPDLSARAHPGSRFAVRVQPRARGGEGLTADAAGALSARVSAPPVDGRANDAVRRLLARALGVAPTRLRLVQGETSRDKLFQLD